MLPRTDGRETLERARCAHWKRGTVSHQKHGWSTQRDPGPKRRGQGRRRKGRECCSSTLAAGQAPQAGPRHSRTRFWQAEPVTLHKGTATCHCNKGSQSAESTAEVCPRRRALLRARQLVLRRRRVLVAWFRPNRTTSHCHLMHSLCWRKQLLHAMWLGLNWCPPIDQQAFVSSALSFKFTLFRLLGN